MLKKVNDNMLPSRTSVLVLNHSGLSLLVIILIIVDNETYLYEDNGNERAKPHVEMFVSTEK